MVSGVDEQFYPCPCGNIYGWYIKADSFVILGWLLDPKSDRREEKEVNGINLVHLYDGMGSIDIDAYINQIRFFKCRVCEKIIRGGMGVTRLINFIRYNWNERTVRNRGF